MRAYTLIVPKHYHSQHHFDISKLMSKLMSLNNAITYAKKRTESTFRTMTHASLSLSLSTSHLELPQQIHDNPQGRTKSDKS
jgi:hypothetical protein